MNSLLNRVSMTSRGLLAATAALAAACSVSESGNIPCVDDSNCPSAYPQCVAGKCVEAQALPDGGSGVSTASVAIVGVNGFAPTDVVSGTVRVSATARASLGVKKVDLKVGTATVAQAPDSAPPLFHFDVTTPVGQGTVTLQAVLTAGDEKTYTSADYALLFDNELPVLTLADPTPQAARRGSVITVNVTSTEPLSSLGGDVLLVATESSTTGTSVGTLAVVSSSGVSHKLAYAVPSTAAGGIYRFSVSGKDVAGNAAAAVAKTARVHAPFTLASTAVSTGLTVAAQPAGKLATPFTVTVKVPIAVSLASPAAVFAFVDSRGVSRGLSGTPTIATDATNSTITLTDAIASGDASGGGSVQVIVTDVAGNQATGAASLLVDRIVPALIGLAASPAVADATSGAPSGTIAVAGTASEVIASATYTTSAGGSGACLCDGAACSASASSTTLVSCAVPVPTVTAPTALTITVRATDAVGNASTDSANQAIAQVVPVPVLTLGTPAPSAARPGTQVTVTVSSTQPLKTLGGTVVRSGSSDTPTALSLLSGTLGVSTSYTLGFGVPANADAGVWVLTVAGTGLAGGATNAPTANTNVYLPFTVSSLAVTSSILQGSVPAGATNAPINVTAKVPATAPLGASAAVFSLVDAVGHTRTFAGSVTTGSSGTSTTVSVSDSISAADVDGVASVRVTITDLAGNSASASAPLIIDNARPFLNNLTFNKTLVDSNTATVTLTGTASKQLAAASFVITAGGSGGNVACTCDGGSCASSTSTAPLVSCTVPVPGSLTADRTVTVAVSSTDPLGNASLNANNQASFSDVRLPHVTTFSGAPLTITQGATSTLSAVYEVGPAGTAWISNSADLSTLPVVSGTPTVVTPPLSTAYTLHVKNAAGTEVTSSLVTVTVQNPGFVGSLAFTEPTVTGGRAAALTLTMPTSLTASSTLVLLDNDGNVAQSPTSTAITSAQLIAAIGGTLQIKPPSTNTATNSTYTYSLVALPIGGGQSKTTAALLTVVPVPTAALAANITKVTTGNLVQLTVTTTGAACTTAGRCQIITSPSSTPIAVLGDTNSGPGVTVTSTVDVTKTYTAQVKNRADDAAFVSSSGVAVTAYPTPVATLTTNLNTVTLGGNLLVLSVTSTGGDCQTAGRCEIFNSTDSTTIPVLGNTNTVAVSVTSTVDMDKIFTARVKNPAQDAVFVNSNAKAITTRPAPTAVLSTTLATVASGNQVQFVVKTTGADCQVGGNCRIVNDFDGTTVAVVGDTNAVSGVTVPVTIDRNRTYRVEVKANAADTLFVSSNGVAVICVTSFLVAGFPSPSVAGVAGNVIVTARDASNATAAGYRGTIQFTSNDGRTGVVLPPNYTFVGGDNPKTFASGVTLTSVSSTASITVTDTTSASTSGTQSGITITPAAAAKLAFSPQPVNGTSMVNLTSIGVQVQDAFGNLSPTSTASVTMSIQNNPSGGALSGTNPVSAVSGVATFSTLKIDKAGTGYALRASASGLGTVDSTAFNIAVGAANKIVFVQQPSDAVSLVTISPSPTVQIQDAGGNNVSSTTPNISVALTTAGGATLGGTLTRTPSAGGLATFSGLNVDKVGSYTLTATASGLTTPTATSGSFNISPAAAAKLAFGQQPTGALATATIAPPVTVQLQDFSGNSVTSSGVGIALALTTPGGATLSGGGSQNTDSTGVATFSGLSVNKTGTYTLTATSSGLTSTTSSSFIIGVGPAAKVAFVQQPTNAVSLVGISPSPTVQLQDAGGNSVTTNNVSITVALTTPGGATLGGTATQQTNPSGLATFPSLTVDKAGTYTLTASSAGVSSGTSTAFTIRAAAASKLAFVQQPSGALSTATITPPVTVQLQDFSGNSVTSSGTGIALALTTPAGAVLTGGGSQNTDTSGISTFSGLSVDKAGAYTLTATSSGLTNAVSNSFTISVGPAAKLAFVQHPTNAVSLVAISPSPTVQLQDAGGNSVTSTGVNVAVALTSAGGAALGGTLTQATNASGLATFAGLTVDKAATYSLTASSGGLANGVSNSFTIRAAAANKLAFVQQPSNASATATIAPAVTVQLQDLSGNSVTSSGVGIALALTTPGSATLTGGGSQNTNTSGISTFSGLSVDKVGTYTLTATSSGLTNGVSNNFTITAGSANKIAWLQGPSNAAALVPLSPSPTIQVQDAGGNAVSSTASITISILNNAGPGGVLSGTPTAAADVNTGVATFSNLMIDKIGTGYTLRATAATVTNPTADSGAFNITPGATSKLTITFPTNVTTNVFNDVTVAAQDAGGNTTPAYTGTVQFSTNDASGSKVLPSNYTFVGGDAGSHTFTGGVKLITITATATLTATDTVATSVSGTKSGINVLDVPVFPNLASISFRPNVMLNGSAPTGLLNYFTLPALQSGAAAQVFVRVAGVNANDNVEILASTAVSKSPSGSFGPSDLNPAVSSTVDAPTTAVGDAPRIFTYSVSSTNAAGGASGTSVQYVPGALNTYKQVVDLASRRAGATVTFLPASINTLSGRDLILITGGCDSFQNNGVVGVGAQSSTAELFDPKTGVTRALGGTADATHSLSMNQGRCQHAAVLAANNKVYLFGGSNTGVAATDKKIDVYDPATETFQKDSGAALPSMVVAPRFAPTATLITTAPAATNEGRIVIAGGYLSSRASPTSSLELFDPVGGTSTIYSGTAGGGASSVFTVGRAEHTATLLGNFIYYVGGATTSASVDVLDVTLGVGAGSQVKNYSAPANSLTRVAHSAVKVSSTKFLVAGGLDSGSAISATPARRLQSYTVDGAGGTPTISASPGSCASVVAGCLNTQRVRAAFVPSAVTNEFLLIGGTVTLGGAGTDDTGTTSIEKISAAVDPPVATNVTPSLIRQRAAPAVANLAVSGASNFVLLVAGSTTGTSSGAEVVISP